MRIGIDAGPIVGGAGGIGAHTTHLLKAMLGLKPDLEVVAYIPSRSLGSVRRDEWVSFPRLEWKEVGRWDWASRGARDGLDLFHGPNFKMRTEGRYGGVVTIHDLWLERHPEYSGKLFGQWWAARRTKRTAWRARRVITVSRFSAREIAAVYGLPPERIEVIPNGVQAEFWEREDQDTAGHIRARLQLQDTPYILFVGGADPRKNHRLFLEAFARRRDDLKPRVPVLVGDPVHRFGNYQATAKAVALDRDVVCVGRVGAEELLYLYRRADMLVFPSLYEGFGIPVLEAMACGTPVITSTTSSLPEVAGEAALLVDPADPEAMGEAMVRLSRDASLRQQLTAKGRERIRQFGWKEAAARTLALYASLCA